MGFGAVIGMKDPVTILYIEDDRASRRLVEKVLTNYGYQVEVASDGLEGIQVATEKQPHLILMDINLPNMDGRAITTRLRSLPHFSKTPIVALTANNNPGNRELALAAGCTGFLTKPIDVASFPKQVDDFLLGRVEPLAAQERAVHLERHAQNVVERLESKVRELELANERLRQLDKMKSDFIILVSHELRTPLTLISGYTHLLKQQLDDAASGNGRSTIALVDGLDNSVGRMREVIVDIINVSRITAGLLELTPVQVDAAEVVRRVCDSFEQIRAERALTLTTNITQTPISFEGDINQVQVAIENVLGNAVKYTPDGGRIHLEMEALADGALFRISDTGIGIPRGEQERIFDQFYVLDSIEHHSTSKSAFRGGGLGLGLAITKGIVDAHGGKVAVESHGRDLDNLPGSTFTLFFPLKLPTFSQ